MEQMQELMHCFTQTKVRNGGQGAERIKNLKKCLYLPEM